MATPRMVPVSLWSNEVLGWKAWRPVDGDVAPVSDLLGEVGRVEDVLWLEERVLPVLSEEAQVQRQPEVGHGLVQESGVACLIP